MRIENVSKPISLPEDLKAQIEKVRIQLEINKQEVLILQKTRISEQGAIEKFIREKKFLKKEIDVLIESVSKGRDELKSTNDLLKKGKKEFELLDAKVQEHKEKVEEIERDKSKFNDYKNDKELEISKKTSELSMRENEIVDKEKQVENRLDKFKNFIENYDKIE